MTAALALSATNGGGLARAVARRDPVTSPRGHGQRLLEAIAAFERFPALAYSRARLLELLAGEAVSAQEAVAVVESDPALALAALRLANRRRPAGSRAICGVPAAVSAAAPAELGAVVEELPVFDFFGRGSNWSAVARSFRVHSVATLRAVERLVREDLVDHPDELRVAALLHDIGKLVVLHAYGRYTTGSEGAPCARVLAERRAWGLDHALVGGVLARRLGLPDRVATLIERHHSDDEVGDAALLRVADTLVHYSAGHPIDRDELIAAADRGGVEGSVLDSLLYDLPAGASGKRPVEPSPLSPRETAALRQLAQGKVYKEIAKELGLAVSTVRSHLHKTYGKLGVVDRAQAVLLASERGWI